MSFGSLKKYQNSKVGSLQLVVKNQCSCLQRNRAAKSRFQNLALLFEFTNDMFCQTTLEFAYSLTNCAFKQFSSL